MDNVASQAGGGTQASGGLMTGLVQLWGRGSWDRGAGKHRRGTGRQSLSVRKACCSSVTTSRIKLESSIWKLVLQFDRGILYLLKLLIS